jgi:hypothetical protein
MFHPQSGCLHWTVTNRMRSCSNLDLIFILIPEYPGRRKRAGKNECSFGCIAAFTEWVAARRESFMQGEGATICQLSQLAAVGCAVLAV